MQSSFFMYLVFLNAERNTYGPPEVAYAVTRVTQSKSRNEQ